MGQRITSLAGMWALLMRLATPGQNTDMLAMGLHIGIGGDEGQTGADGNRRCQNAHRTIGVCLALCIVQDGPSCGAYQSAALFRPY
jgi:hypothetical protein